MSAKFAGVVAGVAGFMCSMAVAGAGGGNGEGFYTEELIYQFRPNPAGERLFGVIGTTGLKPRIYPGVVFKVEDIEDIH